MGYAIYLNDVRMPVNPEKLDSKSDRSIKKYDVIGQGKVGKAENSNLREWSWTSEFPDHDYQYCHNWQPPTVFIGMILELMKLKDPCRLVVSGSGSFTLSVPVLVESFSYSEIFEGTYEYSIALIEFVETKIKETNIPFINRPGIIPLKKDKPKLPDDGPSFEPITAMDFNQAMYDLEVLSGDGKLYMNPLLAEKKESYVIKYNSGRKKQMEERATLVKMVALGIKEAGKAFMSLFDGKKK